MSYTLKNILIGVCAIVAICIVSLIQVAIVEKPVYNYSQLEYSTSSNTFKIFVNYNWGVDHTIDLPPNLTPEQAQYMYEQFLKNR
jgi:hypothetical protein